MISGSSTLEKTGKGKQTVERKPLSARLAALFTNNIAEKTAFQFAWRWTSRSRDFKLRLYPGFGYVIVWILIMVFRFLSDDNETLSRYAEKSPFGLLALIYFSSFMLLNAIHQVNHCDQYKAGWIFFSMPVQIPGKIVLGTFKAIVCKFYLPMVLIFAIVGIVWMGAGLVPNMLLAFSNQLIICSIVILMNQRKLPASLPLTARNKGGVFLEGILMLGISGAVAGAHYLIYTFMPVVVLLALLSFIVCWLLLRKIGSIPWQRMKINTE